MAPAEKRLFVRLATLLILFVLIPLAIFLGVRLFDDRNYKLISVGIAFLSCVPFFVRFEKGRQGARELVVIAVMTAFSVVGRMIFAPVPGFKPVTAMTVISGIALGPEAGFLVGSLSAIVSNLYFGQGPWTPFQMFAWGSIGFVSGIVFRKKDRPNPLVLSVAGAIGGILFSLLMDVWTTISVDGTFQVTRYLVNVLSGISFMAIYAVSNVIFLLILARPFLEKLNRIKKKYGIFQDSWRKESTAGKEAAPPEDPAMSCR